MKNEEPVSHVSDRLQAIVTHSPAVKFAHDRRPLCVAEFRRPLSHRHKMQNVRATLSRPIDPVIAQHIRRPLSSSYLMIDVTRSAETACVPIPMEVGTGHKSRCQSCLMV